MKIRLDIAKAYKSLMLDEGTRLIGKCLLKEDSRRRLEWLKYARSTFKPGAKKPCVVCGMFADISEAHHVINLSHQYCMDYDVPIHNYIWLCPNHHAMLHKLESGNRTDSMIENIPINELEILNEILEINKGAWNGYYNTL